MSGLRHYCLQIVPIQSLDNGILSTAQYTI